MADHAAAPRAQALPLVLIPKEYQDFNKRNQPTARQLSANGQACGFGGKIGVCDNGNCGTFVAPTGFTLIRGAEAQCG
ncbi:hypothetical protein CTRI78_v004096 [Colletotrichum trifolii]|uniref:Uncharacterized protein n=1 Tax=Colletotrichum trifolii TaxID=5466 RepID=A0A4R8RUG8_COLTR|nr:hypothetical protein CTRI78_v004096 [Colletotrichum trifolii]